MPSSSPHPHPVRLLPLLASALLLAQCACAAFEVADSGADEDRGPRARRAVFTTPLGKRITSTMVAELGKRPQELYSFGIGEIKARSL